MALDLTDYSPNSNDLTNVNGVTEETGSLPFAQSTKAAGFAAASTQHFTVVDHASMKPTGNWTFECWIKANLSTIGRIFASYSQNSNVAGIVIYMNTEVVTILSGRNTGVSAGTDYQTHVGAVDVNDNAWHHIACVYNGSTLALFIDGVADGTTSWSNGAGYAATNYVRIGVQSSSGSAENPFNGLMDEVRFWSVARTQTQIQDNMSVKLVGNETGLQGYWPLEAPGSPSSSISPSPSSSVSPSASVSLSPSASQSPSASISPSPSSSISPSPSSSVSLSISPSPSLSVSSSVSPSPSIGYSQYTRGDYLALPTNDNDLETTYTAQDETDVETSNNVRVGQTATSQHMVHQFKDFVGANTACTLEWEGQTTLAPTASTVYLQIYNRDTLSWETVDSDNSSAADTDFLLNATITDLTNYKDASSVIACRVYQLSTP